MYKYKIDKKELKKIFIKDYQKINVFYWILSTIIFALMTKDIIEDNFMTVLIFYVVVMLLLVILLCIANMVYASVLVSNYKKDFKEYDISLDKKNIVINEDKYSIKKLVIKKDRVYVYYDKTSFIIYKKLLLNESDFDKIISKIK